ncbi:Galactose transporter [Pantoea agglomerans]|uniref:Galactose transporter n=1 Tax=Enterobacter agglomerans TaxID=549 RepID=A0A379AB84_ENTAG|nr:Galactose transporter [Pantoea agglomerans]
MPGNTHKSRTSNKAMTLFVCFLAALAGLLFGLDIGVIAGALPFIAKDFNVTPHQQEWIVSFHDVWCGGRCYRQRLDVIPPGP